MDTCPLGTRDTATSYHTSQTVKGAGQGCNSAAHLKPKTAYSLQLDQLSPFLPFYRSDFLPVLFHSQNAAYQILQFFVRDELCILYLSVPQRETYG